MTRTTDMDEQTSDTPATPSATLEKDSETPGSPDESNPSPPPSNSPDSALGASASSPDEVDDTDEDIYTCTLSPETAKKAESELGETEIVRQLALMGLKRRMEQRPDIKFCHDDRFLLRFLRAKKFEVERAFNSLVKYYELHLKHPDFFKNYKPSAIKHVLDDGFPMVFGQLDEEGRPVVAMKAGMKHCQITLDNCSFIRTKCIQIMIIVFKGLLHP